MSLGKIERDTHILYNNNHNNNNISSLSVKIHLNSMAVHSEDKHSQKENTKELDMNVVKEA